MKKAESNAASYRLRQPRLWVTGINHRAVDLAVRERLAMDAGQLGALLDDLVPAVLDEAVIVSTCNRTEVYAVSSDGQDQREVVLRMLAQFAGLALGHLSQWVYTYQDAATARHLFAVAAGLDSLVPGDAQINGQIREALEIAQSHHSVGAILSRFFREAINLGKTVRATTSYGQPDATVSTAAVELVQRLLSGTATNGALVVGAGKAASGVVEGLFRQKLGPVLVTNRTYEAAYQLTNKIGGRALRFDDVVAALASTDVVISATAAPHLVLRRALIEGALARREGRPLYMIDIAVPRDIEPTVRDLAGVVLYDLDDLQGMGVVDRGAIQKEADQVWTLVESRAAEFGSWFESLAAVPTIVALRERAEQVRQEELRKTLARLPHLSDEERDALEALTSAIVNKLLHSPSVELRNGADGWSTDDRLRAAEKLFGLK